MPYIAQTRTDIPNGVLQVLDLWPYTSQRSIYDPPGQTKYINRGEFTGAGQNAARPTTVSGAATATYDVYGLAAYFADNIDDVNAGASLFFSAAFANAAATGVAALVDAGAVLDSTAIDGVLNGVSAGSGLGNGTSTGSVADVLQIVAGGSYLLPAGSAIGGLAAAMGNGSFQTGTYKTTVDGMALAASFAAGSLATYTAGTFSYDGTAGQALVVYNDDGTLYT